MNAQSHVSPMLTALSALVAATLNKKADTAKAGEAGKSATDALRDFASLSAEAGVPVQRAQDAMKLAFTKANVKAGTAKPYIRALGGFRQAIAEGANIADTGEGKPMTVPQANIYLTPKDEREAEKAIEDVRREIAKRVRGVKNLAELIEFRDLLPEVKGEVKTVEVAQDAADLLAEYITDDDSDDVETGEAIAA